MNSALFALLGTLFGGDGRTTFALPNLRGRVVIGTAPSMYSVGAQGGSETHTLTIDEMPSHAHGVPGLSVSPAVMVKEAKNDNNAVTVQSTTPGATESTQSTGGGQAHNNMQPYLAMTTCIAVEGIFPSRN
jgi:microcystin-dependent protein